MTGDITQVEPKSKNVTVGLSSTHETSPRFNLRNIRTVANLDLPKQSLLQEVLSSHSHLHNLPIEPYAGVRATLLLGVDNAKLGVPLKVKEVEGDQLIATKCRLGWSVYGRGEEANAISNRVMHICSCVSTERMDEMLKANYALEAVGISMKDEPLKSKADERALAIMQSTTKYLENEKRWETGLLWKFDKIDLPNSYSMALQRLSCLEKRMTRDPILRKFLNKQIREYEDKGYIRKLTKDEISHGKKAWFIPIFTVTNKNKNKTRLVWDAAATVDGIALNTYLMKGPDLLASLVGVLIRFRERPYTITGDIREMFHQIRVRSEDQTAQQFLWRHGNSSRDPDTYVMTVMTFGAACSPSLANFIKNKNASRFVNENPSAVGAIHRNMYVDDWLQSVDTEKELIDLALQVKHIHGEGGFEMRNWLSNSTNALHAISRTAKQSGKLFQDPSMTYEKVLGIWWLPWSDELTFFAKFDTSVFGNNSSVTKRSVLRVIMSVYDPLGLIGFFMIQAKIVMQNIWRSGVTWDAPVQKDEHEAWQLWVRLLPRTLPISEEVYWTDSKNVLHWIRSDTRKFSQFVGVRIGEILESSSINNWRWVPSADNVADDATKMKQWSKLDGELRWFQGPQFLTLPSLEWPETILVNSAEHELVHHIELNTTLSFTSFTEVVPHVSRFSKWEKLRGATRYALRFLRLISRRPAKSEFVQMMLQDTTVNSAEVLIVLMCQSETFGDEIKCLHQGQLISRKSSIFKCSAFIDEFGLLRIKGRIDSIEGVPVSVKRPIILPSRHPVTLLIIDFFHRKYHHHHNEVVVNEIRQKYWVSGLRALVGSVGRKCQVCRIRKAVPQPPQMGSLPPERLALNMRPFTYTGVDFFGPIDVVVGRHHEKRWGVLFTCLTVRAVHIEITHSLSTDAFLLILKQFICRRGVPRRIISDNATNFRGASRILQSEIERISSDELQQRYPEVEWRFIPPAAPHMGGAWERMIRSVKSILSDILRANIIHEHILRAALADVENVLNSRPLTYIPLATANDEALTPNHFLLGGSSGLRERSIEDSSGATLRKNFRVASQLADQFWRRWVREYLPNLTRRAKWYQPPPEPVDNGDVVIIVDETSKRNTWIKGIVIEVLRAKDGQARSAIVKTIHGLITRPIVKLAKLDLSG